MGDIHYGYASNDRRLGACWNGIPLDRPYDPGAGLIFFDDFYELSDEYTATQATAGTFAMTDAAYGVALADCNSTTATQGINVQKNTTVGELFIPTAGTTIVFECRIKAVDIATGPEFFVGLHQIDTTIIASSAMSGANYIGWQSITDDGVLLFTGAKASAADTNTATTFVDGTWVKLGFKVNGVTSVDQYINGVLQDSSTALATANIPVTEMVPSLVCQSGGTTDPIIHIDWWMCAQTSA